MKTQLVKGVNDTLSIFKHLLAFLLFDDLFHAAIMSLNSFINDNYCSEGNTV